MNKMISCLITSILISLNAFISLGAIIEKSNIIVSNGTKTVTISTNGTILLNNIDITQVITNNVFPPLTSTNNGSEGIRLIGALGGYTLEEFIEDTATRGPARDLPIFSYTSYPTKNLVITYSDGDIYDPVNGYYHLNTGSKTLVDNAVNYAYWSMVDPQIIQWTTGTRPNAIDNIYLGTFIAAFGSIIHAAPTIAVGDELLYEDVAFANIFPSIITDGLITYATGTDLTNIIISAGVEYHNMADRVVHPPVDFNTNQNMVIYSHTGGVWAAISTNLFPVGSYDNGTNFVLCAESNWYRGVFVSIADSRQMTWVAPDNVYTSYLDAVAGSDPDLPPSFTPYIPKSTAYVFAGSDTVLRVESQYWIDRRPRAGSSTVVVGTGSGSVNTPSLAQVLQAGTGTGGLLPSGMGDPVNDDQAASKGYVDSTRNKASTGTAFVDPTNGDDGTGRIEKASLPFKTIQAAINACAVVASDARRFLVTASIGTYVEDVTMKDFTSVRGMDIESTIIRGSVTWPSTYTDTVGSELQVLSVYATNKAALTFSGGSDLAYVGTRSVAVYSTWTNDAPIKCTIRNERGWVETYGTTWVQTDVYPDGAAGISTGIVCSIYATTNASNLGNIYYNDFCGSYIMNVTDTNDVVCTVFSDSSGKDYIAIKNSAIKMDLSDSTNHNNRISAIYHRGSDSRTFMNGSSYEVILDETNNVTVIMAYVGNSAGDGSEAHFNSSRIICPNINSNAAYIGAAITANDRVEVFNSSVGGEVAGNISYPGEYTADGSSGIIAYIVNHASGDLLIGGGVDLSADNPNNVIPQVGHGRLYTQTTSGFENPYFIDSMGLKLREFRDGVRTLYNAEATPLLKGEVVCMFAGVSGTASYVKRAKANSLSTKAYGVVLSTSIAAGSTGRISVGGKIESGIDTSYCTANDALYLSGTVSGGFTNVAPSDPYYIQPIGRACTVGTNGSIHVDCRDADVLGNQLPSYYATQSAMDSTTNRVKSIENSTSLWNQASIDSTNAWLNRVSGMEGRTSVWNVASLTSIDATNRIAAMESKTSTWNTASSTSINATNRVTVIEGRTNTWNGTTATVNNMPTSNWNTAYLTIGNTVTNSWGFNEPSPTTTKPNDIYLSSELHKARNWVEFHAMTESGIVLGQIIIRNNRNPIRTYTVVTNFSATITSTNPIIITGTIPAFYSIGVAITNVGASTTNLWMSLDFATINGLRDL